MKPKCEYKRMTIDQLEKEYEITKEKAKKEDIVGGSIRQSIHLGFIAIEMADRKIKIIDEKEL